MGYPADVQLYQGAAPPQDVWLYAVPIGKAPSYSFDVILWPTSASNDVTLSSLVVANGYLNGIGGAQLDQVAAVGVGTAGGTTITGSGAPVLGPVIAAGVGAGFVVVGSGAARVADVTPAGAGATVVFGAVYPLARRRVQSAAARSAPIAAQPRGPAKGAIGR